MDKAKQAISGFVGRSGQHDTTVHEAVAPAVQHETVKPHHHEEVNTAVDKEIHQDHYHRTVQPVHDREVLPEQHHAKLGAVQHREHDHRDHEGTKRHLTQDQAQFKDERRMDAATTSQSVAPVVGGEHQHHHIHETIQPVVQKETIQPHVTHTTVPIHEVHHNKATHHDTTALPAMTMDQFKSKGGALTGREERYDEFQGVPKNIGGGIHGATQGLEKKTHTHGADHARHGDFDNTANHHSSGAGIRQGGLTGATTGATSGTSGSGLANTSSTTGTTGTTTGSGLTGTGSHHEHGERGAHGLSGAGTGSHHEHGERGAHGLSGAGTGVATGAGTAAGLSGSHHDHADRGLGGQGNLTGSSTQGGVASGHGNNLSSNRSDNLSSTTSGHRGTDGAIGGAAGGAGVAGAAATAGSKMKPTDEHLDNDHLPKALTEDRSKAVPHSPLNNNKEAGRHDSHGATEQKKPGLMDKLNPKKDADGDGKAGFMS